MPAPKDLPGFYFDTEKNRYFPIKGRIPGLKRHSSPEKCKKQQVNKEERKNRTKNLELVKLRELFGASIDLKRSRCNFTCEYEKFQASHPQIWKYQDTACAADCALEQMHGVVQTPEGLKDIHLLSAGSVNGSIRLYDFGNLGQRFLFGTKCPPAAVWQERTRHEAVGNIWTSPEVTVWFPSCRISCIRKIGRESSSFQRALVTTLGSGVPGSVEILDLTEPFEFNPSDVPLLQRISQVTKRCGTIWTADCSWNGRHAVIGTDSGADLLHLETGTSSWIYRSKSDVFSQQFDHSGKIVLCGLRNGGITVVDVREKQSSVREMRINKRPRQSSEATRNSTSRKNPFMPSAVCSLVALQSDDQYFLGSSMDGSIKLFDRRLLQRGAIQSYEGHVNSHSHLELSVNPSETLMLSGGEDHYMRIWSIKTGDLIFEEIFSNSIFATACWSHGGFKGNNSFERNHSWGAWLGSNEGLFYMHGS